MPISLDSARSNELKIRRVKDANSSYGNVGQILEVNPQGLAVWGDISAVDLSGFLTNPLTADLDAANYNIVNVNTLNSNDISLTTLIDSYPPSFPELNVKYLEQIITGNYNRQPVQGIQEDFNPAVGFPTQLPCQMSNGLYTQAINGVFSRRTALTLTPGLAGNYLNIGQQVLFTDRLVYDPLNMRYDPVVPNAWTAVKISSNLGPSVPEPIGTQVKGLLKIYTHLEGAWTNQNNSNTLKIYARHYRGLGAVLRDYQIALISHNGIDVVADGTKYILGYAGVGEDILNDDYFEVWLENNGGSPHDFTVSLFKVLVEWIPCP